MEEGGWDTCFGSCFSFCVHRKGRGRGQTESASRNGGQSFDDMEKSVLGVLSGLDSPEMLSASLRQG